MQTATIKAKLEQIGIEVDSLVDEKTKEAIYLLFNLIEELSSTVRKLQEENQRLRDENNLLKGEKPKPIFRPSRDISSEEERKVKETKETRNRESKVEKIKINRTETCKVDPEILPEDAEFKGYESVIVQDLKIETDNIEFKKEVYYSPSLRKSYRGELPLGYEGSYGPTVRALTIIMKYVCNTSEPKILEFFRNFNIHISSSSISGMLIKNKEAFHQEKEELYKAGLTSTDYQQIDATGARVNGENCHTHIVCNELYTAYFTTKGKDRLTIIDILSAFKERSYCFNEETFDLLEQLRVAKKVIRELSHFEQGREYTEEELEGLLKEYLPEIGKVQKTRILEAAAIASYHKGIGYPVVKVLICDDAPQFKLITEDLGLCWVHDGRHYKKLSPIVAHHMKKLEEFRKEYWEYYDRLLKFKEEPTKEFAEELSVEFDKLFSKETGYQELDERISKTKSKKEELLMVLKYPEIPLHNNESELGARAQVRRRDVSLQTKTEEGTKSSDTFLTIVQTAKKLGVNAYDYIFDRVSKKFELPSLAEIIRRKTIKKEIAFCDTG